MSTTYNGWKNYETWAVNLWISNDQGSQEYWAEVAEEVATDAEGDTYEERKDNFASDMATRLKDELEESMPDLGCTLWADLLGSAMSEVDWYEIAQHYADDVEDTLKATETDAE